MGRLVIAAMAALMYASVSRADNVITNGGFERLDAAYFPADWSAVGRGVSVTTDAHSGRYALRLNRSRTTPMDPETGLNRGWNPNGGRGAMLDETHGIVRAWIKVNSAATDASIVLVVIPMAEPGFENTGEQRAIRTIPADMADGRWHEFRVAYDYRANKDVRWVHVGMRLTGGPADVIVDDFEYIAGAAPILQFEKLHIYPDKAEPDRRAMLTATLSNDGTAAVGPVSLVVHLPDGMTAEGPTQAGPLEAGDGAPLRWTIRGSLRPGVIRLTAVSPSERIERSVALSPRVELVSALASPGIVMPGRAVTVAVTVWNRGTATSPPAKIKLRTYGGARAATGEIVFGPIAAGRHVAKSFRMTAARSAGAACGVVCIPSGASSGDVQTVALEVTDAVNARQVAVVPGLYVRRGSDRTIAEAVRTVKGSPSVAFRMPHLGRLTVRLPDGRVETLTAVHSAPKRTAGGVVLGSSRRDRAGGGWSFAAEVIRLRPDVFRLTISARCTRARRVCLFEGPTLLVGEGGKGSARYEAIFPGLEWLVDNEVSSSDLDIVADHPDRRRYAPHPNKVTIPAMSVADGAGAVAMLWDPSARWDGVRDRPQPTFASPDRLGGMAAHRMGLIAPNPIGRTNATATGTPGEAHATVQDAVKDPSADLALPAGRTLRLSAVIFVGGRGTGALDAVEQWFVWHKPAPPAPAPKGSDLAQVSWSMQAYLRTLWDTPSTGWFPYLLGPAIWRKPAHNQSYAYDLLQAIRMIPDDPARPQWEDRLASAGFPAPSRDGGGLPLPDRIPSADDMQFGEGDPIAFLNQQATAVMSLIASQSADGAWVFDADLRDHGVFRGYDYHELGEPGEVEVGLIALKASRLLQMARVTGDRSFYDAGVRSLKRMEKFRVPRAAQVWEVPVHTPDILAAADAVDAYLEAYWFSGNKDWLAKARLWARRGMPFVYVWNAPGMTWMRYGSIPVFGASGKRGSWFGHVVQWNGLRLALAYLKLHPHDPDTRLGGLSWRDLAVGITRSAMYQQSHKAEYLAAWPDSLHTITGVRAAWEFAPRQILKNVFWWLGRREMPLTTRVRAGTGDTVRITSLGQIAKAQVTETGLTFTVTHPPNGRGSVLISGVTEPTRVTVGGARVPVARQRLGGGIAGWRYDPRMRAAAVHIPRDGPVEVRLDGVRPAQSDLAVPLARRIAFEFDAGFDGWGAENDTTDFRASDGALAGRSTGGDPYLVRPNCSVRGDDVAEVRLRIRATGNGGGQFFWTTSSSPAFDEAKALRFSFPPDGDWHEVALQVGQHPRWKGQTVTAIRIDPASASSVAFAIDWVRAR